MEEHNKRIQIKLDTEAAIAHINASCANTVNCLKSYQAKIIELHEQLEKINQDFENQKEAYLRIDSAYHRERDTNILYTKKNEELVSEKAKLEERCSTLNRRIEELTASVNASRYTADENYRKYEAAQAANTQLTGEKAKLEERCSTLNHRIEELNGQVAEKTYIISDYSATIAKQDSEIKQLSDSVNDSRHTADENYRKYENSQKELTSVTAEKNTVTQQLSDARSENTRLEQEIQKFIEQKSDIEKELSKAHERITHYRSLNMDKLDRAYTLFSSFKERTKNNLKAVFETDTFLGFISKSMQWERIAGIWEQAKRKIVNDDTEDAQELRELFLILFEVYNAGYAESPYELINPTIGSHYNSNEQLIKNQKSDGVITEVLLEGYIFKKTSVAHKAMICVE